MSLQDYMGEIRTLIHAAMLSLDCEDYERFAEYVNACLEGQE